jgi:hypothetical protein
MAVHFEPASSGGIHFEPIETPEVPADRPGLAERIGKGLYNAAIAGPLQAVRTQSSAGQVRRDTEILKQYRMARERGEPEPSFQEASRRADEAVAGRDRQPLALGGTPGQILAGNVLPMPEAETIPEKVADVGSGVAGFIANLAATKKVFPGMPEALAWETQNQVTGGLPGTGAAMAGTLGVVGKSSMPAAAKIATESAIFGGLAAAEGGDAEDIAIAAAIPATLGGARAGKRALRKRAAAKELASDKAVLEQAIAEQRAKEPVAPAVRSVVPDIVYHATTQEFEGLPSRQPARTGYFEEGEPAGIFYSTDPGKAQAATGAQGKQRVIPAKVTAKNVFVVDDTTADAYRDREVRVVSQWVEEARKTFGNDIDSFVERDRQGQISGFTGGKTWKGADQRLPDWSIAERLAEEYQHAGYDAIYDIRKGDFIVLSPSAVTSQASAGADLGKDVEVVQERPQIPANEDVSTQAPSPEKLPSARQEYIRQEREARGLPPTEEVIPRGTREQWRKEAIEQGKVEQAFDIAKDLLEKPRAATPQESEGMFIRHEQIGAEFDVANEQLAKLSADSPGWGAISQRAERLGQQLDVLDKVLDQVSGRMAGQSLGVRRGQAGDNTKTLSVVGRAKAAAGGELKPGVQGRLVESVKAFRIASRQSKAITAKSQERTARRAIRRGGRLSRYAKMTDVEKDVELKELLAQEQTPKVLHDIAMNLASRGGNVTAESVTRKMQELIPGLEPADVVEAVVATSQRKAVNTNATIQLLQSLKRTFRKIDKEGVGIQDVLYWLKNGEVPEKPGRAPITEDAVVTTLKEIRDGLKRVMADSEPAQQQKMQRKLDFLNARIANRDFAPKPKQTTYEPSLRVLEMQYQAARLDSEIRRQIVQQRPWTWRGAAAEPLRIVMALKSSFDMSGLGNQGGWALLSHPVRTLRRMPEALAAFTSEKKAWAINEKIRQRENASLYFRDGLELVEATGHAAFTHGEEQYRSNLAEYIPGIKGSNRSFATLLNLIRADSYDAMAKSFAGEGGPTRIEGKAISDFINMLTGRGNIGGYEQTVAAANGLFWAPRRAISRFQTLATLGGQVEWGRSTQPGKMNLSPVHLRGTSATRKMFATEMGRYAIGLTTIYTLAALAGATVELDPRSSDFGKMKFGNVRIDPLSGLSQTLVFLSREFSGQMKKGSGEIMNVRGPNRPYKGDTMGDVGLRFLSYKANPGLAVGWSILSGETEFDGPTTPWTVLKNSLVPMSFEDIYKAMQDQGLSRGVAISMLGLIGMGVQVYGDELTRAEYEEIYGNDG